jgi:hypothetical protein
MLTSLRFCGVLLLITIGMASSVSGQFWYSVDGPVPLFVD